MSTFNKPQGISWDPASVELPPLPSVPPGADAMSMTIAAVLPTLAAPLQASVASLQAKETMFSGKVGAAQAAYEGADQSGGQSVGQLGSMMGQMSQMGQQAAQAGQGAGGGSGMFGQMMQQAMQAAQSFGQQGGGGSQPGASPQGGGPQGGTSQAGGAPASMGQSPAGGAPANAAREENPGDTQDPAGAREDRETRREDVAEHPPVEQSPAGASGPEPGSRGPGPAPVESPQSPRHGGQDDLARRM